MVLTKSELIASLQNEVRILLHLASKIDRAQLEYRPTPKQRSTIELLKYLSVMGPAFVQSTTGAFDMAAWTSATLAAEARDFDQTLAAIAGHVDAYETLLAGVSDADLRTEINGLDGSKTTRGAALVNLVLCGCAAYRTQLFLYLKACGREELSTMNLWAGVDAPAVV
jgi:hypothetical protein